MGWPLIILAVLGHGFLWVGVVNRLHARRMQRPRLRFVTRLCLAVFFCLPAWIVWHAGRTGATWTAPLSMSANWESFYIAVCAVVGVCSIVVKLHEEATRYDRQTLVHWESEVHDVAAAVDVPLQHGKYANRLARIPGNQVTQLSIDHKGLALPNLPVELTGLRIVHLSDLHMTGRIGREYFEFLADQVNRLQPDVVALTGDIVEKTECWTWLDSTLALTEARYGKYFILGNHDYFIDAEETVARLSAANWSYVGGAWLQQVWNDRNVLIGGNELPWHGPAAPMPGYIEASCFRVSLLHTPDQFGWSCQAGSDLVLAGHTHGGQVRPPLLGALASPSFHGTRYCCGLFRRGKTVMHVTRGVSGKTPLRWNCPPELAVLELKCKYDARASSM